MPPQDPATLHEHPEPDSPAQMLSDHYEQDGEDDRWAQERDELPPRPRRRLLTPAPLALLAVLLIACGFIGGVLVEKGQSPAGSTAAATSGLAARFSALRGGASGSTAGSGGSGATSSPGAGAGGAGIAGLGGGRATIGQVAYLSGDTLYVTTSEGTTIKVKTSAATSVNKTVTTSVKAIHPGETVTVSGTSAGNGTVSAESIRVGAAGGSFAGLFGGAGSGSSSGSDRSAGTGASAGGSSGGGGEPALFGNGG
jgi:hypothetical protein